MPNRILSAKANTPEYPRVRFFRKKTDNGKITLEDTTSHVAMIAIEKLEGEDDSHYLVRENAAGELVWKTLHLSLDEAKWRADFEYQIKDGSWTAVTPPNSNG